MVPVVVEVSRTGDGHNQKGFIYLSERELEHEGAAELVVVDDWANLGRVLGVGSLLLHLIRRRRLVRVQSVLSLCQRSNAIFDGQGMMPRLAGRCSGLSNSAESLETPPAGPSA